VSANQSVIGSKQSLIRLYKLEMKGFVQYGQAFFFMFCHRFATLSKCQSLLIIDVVQTKRN